jgi:hypothetical protein
VGGEGVVLTGGGRGETQAPGREAVEGGADLARFLRPAEEGGVRNGSRAQEFPGSGEEVVEVFGEVPAVRAHA